MKKSEEEAQIIPIKNDEVAFKDTCLKQIDWLNKTEKQINSKTRMLRASQKSFKNYLVYLNDLNNNPNKY